jgi:Ca-activated chloride channel family protein
MMLDFDAYAMLGVAHDASAEDIKAAFRRAARRLHPDSNRDHPGAGVQFQDVSAAYELLIDSHQRRAYDEALRKKPDFPQFTMRVTPSRRSFAHLDETQVVYLLTEIIPDPRARAVAESRETRLNLTLVLDRSNSMHGGWLDRVKVAAHQIIDQMNAEDILSIVTFNDFAEVVVEASPVQDKAAMKAKVSMIAAAGSTEIYQGMRLGAEQNRKYLAPRLVNTILFITDGQTFTDHEATAGLAADLAKEGITLHVMGLGDEWDDKFLDRIASATGGTSAYIASSRAVVQFVNDHVRNLSKVFVERVTLAVAPDPDIRFESAFRLSPSAQPVAIDQPYITLGGLQHNRIISLLLQFEMPAAMKPGFRSVARLVSAGDIFFQGVQHVRLMSDLSVEITPQPTTEEPPANVLDALSKLTLYRMQERAEEALERGDVAEAGERLQKLATRLLEVGEDDLSRKAQANAHGLARSGQIAEEDRRSLKFQTRHLLAGPQMGGDGT